MAKETAEQKLLKLIEATQAKDGGAAASPVASASATAPKPQSVLAGAPAESRKLVVSGATGDAFQAAPVAVADEALKIAAAVQGRTRSIHERESSALEKKFSEFLHTVVFYIQNPQALGLSGFNRILLAVVIVLFFTLAGEFQRGMGFAQQDLRIFPGMQALKERLNEATEDIATIYRDLAEYATVVARRNIFQPFEKKKAEAEISAEAAAAVATVPSREQIAAKIANFRLVGISWQNSADTATVMIEDKQTQVTHFLKRGEELQGVKIDTIFADAVVFTFGGENLTVRL